VIRPSGLCRKGKSLQAIGTVILLSIHDLRCSLWRCRLETFHNKFQVACCRAIWEALAREMKFCEVSVKLNNQNKRVCVKTARVLGVVLWC
jgi:hypothetical protein